ncbi:MAG TPA: glycosyltransferase N-terminal domain-containing protein [Chthoniobacteraceae bacterium]
MPEPRPLPTDARRSLLVYNLAFPFVFLALLPSFLIRLLRRGNFRFRFGQRFGFYAAEDRQRFTSNRPLWIHSISVGETLVALKLARQIHATSPETKIVLSTTTSTGFALARESESEWLEAIYNPIDLPVIVRRTLDALQPAQICLIEGEAWPNLVAESHRRGIPITLVNARLSPRSARRFRRFRAWTGPIFRLLDAVFVTDPEDVDRWQSLGVPRERLELTGNIKFDHGASGDSRADEFRALVAPLGVTAATPVLLAGSTFDGEEKLLTAALVELRRKHPDLFLILVPRHVERTTAVLHDLAEFKLRITRRSTLPTSDPAPCDVLLVDTTGELRDWYHLATVVFIGKSLTAIGGQNPAEAVILGKPVVFGPHMENFDLLVTRLLSSEAAIQIPAAEALTPTLDALLTNESHRTALGSRGIHTLGPHQGATAHTAQLLTAGNAKPVETAVRTAVASRPVAAPEER